MFTLNLQNDVIYMQDIKPEHLPHILNWYNKVDDFKFATGIDTPISLDVLIGKYSEAAISDDEFFSGVYIKKEKKMIGIIKGTVKYRSKDTVWINSIVIDTVYQSKGYGRMTLDLLVNHLKANNEVKSIYLAVVEENLKARAFWNGQGFKELRKIENHLKFKDKPYNVIVMSKEI